MYLFAGGLLKNEITLKDKNMVGHSPPSSPNPYGPAHLIAANNALILLRLATLTMNRFFHINCKIRHNEKMKKQVDIVLLASND